MWGGRVEAGLYAWLTQFGLPLEGVNDKNTYIIVEPLLCMMDAGSTDLSSHIYSS